MPTVTSPTSTVAAATPVVTVFWLKDPADPTVNRQVWVHAFDRLDTSVDTAVFEPLQAPAAASPVYPVVAYGAIRPARGTLTLHAQTKTERDAIKAMLNARRPLLLQAPPEASGEPGEQWYIAVGDKHGQSRLIQGQNPRRLLDFEFVEVAQP